MTGNFANSACGCGTKPRSGAPALRDGDRPLALRARVRLAAWLLALGFAGAAAFSGVGEIRSAALPPEARQTLALIRAGGPFPYPKDDSAFGNRERLLPVRRRGYYREYTVATPGLRDRGARRIVAGREGERYYTEDHYRTFKRILE